MVVWKEKFDDQLFLYMNGQLIYKRWFKNEYRDADRSRVFNYSAFGDKNVVSPTDAKHYKIDSI